MKKIYPFIAVAFLWSIFSIWICFREEQYYWTILLIFLGSIPLIWELYFAKYFISKVTHISVRKDTKKTEKEKGDSSILNENKNIPDKFIDCDWISSGYGKITRLCDMIFLEDGLIVSLYSSLDGWTAFLGLLGRRIALKKRKRMSAEIKNFSPEEILRYSKKNFKISYSEITESELKKIRFLFNSVMILKLNTSIGVHRFSLLGKNKLRPDKLLLTNYKEILIDRFPNIIMK